MVQSSKHQLGKEIMKQHLNNKSNFKISNGFFCHNLKHLLKLMNWWEVWRGMESMLLHYNSSVHFFVMLAMLFSMISGSDIKRKSFMETIRQSESDKFHPFLVWIKLIYGRLRWNMLGTSPQWTKTSNHIKSYLDLKI